MSTAFNDIRAVLHSYLDALYTCDLNLFDEVFHPGAVYATADEVPELIRSMDEYFPVIAKRTPQATSGAPRRERIESIELAGDNTAMARVTVTMAGQDYVDFLSLIRTGGKWQIIAKVFHMSKSAKEDT